MLAKLHTWIFFLLWELITSLTPKQNWNSISCGDFSDSDNFSSW